MQAQMSIAYFRFAGAEESLDTLVGESTVGDWKLTVTDFFEIDTGTPLRVTLSSVNAGDEVKIATSSQLPDGNAK